MIKLRLFSWAKAQEFVDLWNQLFFTKPKFTPLTVDILKYIITKPNYIKFENTSLLLIYIDDKLIGFFHYFVVPDFLRENFFNVFSKDLNIILICNFAILPVYRGRGIATEVMKYILNQYGDISLIYPGMGEKDYLEKEGLTTSACVAVFDTKNISNFWGNALYPDQILWGHPEGIGIQESDVPAKRFIEKFSLLPLKKAVELKLNLTTISFYEYKKGLHNVIAVDNLAPQLNEHLNNLKPFSSRYFSRTFIITDSSEKIIGYLIVFPLKLASHDEWGIYEVNVAVKRKGIGSALMNEALKFLKGKGCKTLYTITIPDESESAVEFYKKFGFVECGTWLV